MNNYVSGHAAEKRAARYLVHLGFKIHQLNWRTKYCEIDVIAQRGPRLYFVEVKYQRSGQGWSFERVTAKKIARMRFASRLWMAQNSWQGQAALAVVGVDGSTFRLRVLDG